MQREELVGLILLSVLCIAAAVTVIVLGILRHSVNLLVGALVLVLFSILSSALLVTKWRASHL